MRIEVIRGVLEKLSDRLQFRLGIEAFIEPPATCGYDEINEGYKLIIRSDAIKPSNGDCIVSIAKELSLKCMWVWRMEEFWLMIYTPVS